MIIDTMTTKVTKNGYAAYDPQSPSVRHPAGKSEQSRISPTHSSFVATRNSVSIAIGNDSKLACSLSASPRRVDPNVNTPTYA